MKDELFIRGEVPMTKEEVRAISLAKLSLHQAKSLLDIGAGTGSIAVEAALNHPDLRIIAVDNNPEAIRLIRENQRKFETKNIISINTTAPFVTEKRFDAIFIGGTGESMIEILAWSLQHLNPQGKLVMNFILQENAMQAIHWLQEQNHVFDAIQVQVGKYTPLGSGHYYKPSNPVIILDTRKEG